MAVFLGLDCGGSSCRALAVNEAGQVLFQGHSGPANILSTPVHLLRRNLAQATDGCPSATSVAGCFAGLVNDSEGRRAEDLLRELMPRAAIRAVPDYCAAFMASPDGTDACVIAGTGSVICSRKGDGWVKSGGRGYLLGNPGSAFRFGQDALLQYLNAPADATEATKAILLKTFGCLDEPSIIAKLYRGPSPPALMAKLAPIVAKDARSGAAYALESITNQLSILAAQTADHMERHFPTAETLSISCAGGVWELSPAFLQSFAESVKERMPNKTLTVARTRRPPVQGAALLAAEMRA